MIYLRGFIKGKSKANDYSNTRSRNSHSNFWLKNELYNLKVKTEIFWFHRMTEWYDWMTDWMTGCSASFSL